MSYSLLTLRCRVSVIQNAIHFTSCRRLAHNESKKEREKQIRQYVLSRYMQYVQQYTSALGEKFPAAMRVYRVFTIGIKDFYSDLKLYLAVFHKLNLGSEGIETLSRKELEIYHKMPKDMVKIAPVLLISALPFANYVIFPLAYWFPRHLLTSHFWSLQQKNEFAQLEHKKRLKHFKGVFRALQARVDSIEHSTLRSHWEHVVRLLGSGLHPSIKQVLICKTLFEEEPYDLNSLYSSHLKELLKIHSMHTGWRRKKRLARRAKLIQLMDQAIWREGGVGCLTQDEIRSVCLFRGLNPANMKREDMEEWLNNWLELSQCVRKETRSLLLHSPVLLTYNHPSNWILLH